MVVTHLDANNTGDYADAWATVAAWSILASQGTATGDSLVAFSI